MSASAPTPAMTRVIAEIPAHGDFPAAARVVERLRAAVGRENCAALDVARIILADPGSASKVLRLVNSAFYRKDGPAISTISRAVIVVGFEAIRDLTTGFLLIDALLRQGRSSKIVRDGLRRALLAGFLAQRLAPHAGYPNAEEAYLLGLFADWGTLWLAAYHGAALDAALAAARERDVSTADAVRATFGAGPEELAAAILERWNFPPAFAEHFRQPAPASPAEMQTPGRRLSAVVHLAADWARALDDGADVPAAILTRAEVLFGLRPEQATALSRAAEAAARDQAQLLGLGAPRRQPVGRAPSRPSAHEAGGCDAREILGMVAEITRSIAEQRDVNQVLLMVLEGVARAGPFDIVFLALMTRERDRLVGRLGTGDGVDEYLARLTVPVRAGAGLLAETVLDGSPRVVPDGAAARLVAPDAGAAPLGFASFVTCPLVVRGRSVGVLVAARTGDPPVTHGDVPTIELFCNQAAVALHQYAR